MCVQGMLIATEVQTELEIRYLYSNTCIYVHIFLFLYLYMYLYIFKNEFIRIVPIPNQHYEFEASLLSSVIVITFSDHDKSGFY